MIKYFHNIELKRSSLIILILAFFTLSCCFFIVNTSYEKVKSNYVESNIAIAGEIIKNHPELGKEIVPIIIKGASSETVQNSKSLLKEYGISENIEMCFITPIESSYKTTLKSLFFSLSLFFIFVFILNSIEHICIYRKIETLILAAKNILDLKFQIGIYENAEGTFAKLSHAFNNMRIIMKNNFLQVQREKKFLEELLSDISHQLKTPISSLMIYNDILLNRKIDEEKRIEFLENSGKQLNRIEWLIKSLLQLAKLDAGVIKFEKNSCDINKTVEAAVETLKVKAECEKINLKFNIRENPIIIKHDVNWLSEGIINLIKNAIEHTQKEGTVEISTERTAISVKIIVKDNGEGISKEEIPHIFKRFYKGKKSKKTESVGIGLALSKSIVEAHGGIVEVKSKSNEGSTFTIIFLSVS